MTSFLLVMCPVSFVEWAISDRVPVCHERVLTLAHCDDIMTLTPEGERTRALLFTQRRRETLMADTTPGTIILVNGCMSAGKTSIVKAVQRTFDEPYLHLGD